ESSLIHLMRVNILKRLESSIHSFKITIGNQLEQVNKMIESIDNHEENILSGHSEEDVSILDIDPNDTTFEDLLVGNKVKVLLQDTDTIKWKQELAADQEILEEMLFKAKKVHPEEDSKLNNLKDLMIEKITNPINK